MVLANECKDEGKQNCEFESTKCFVYLKHSYTSCIKWHDRCMEVVKIKCESDSEDLQQMEIIAE